MNEKAYARAVDALWSILLSVALRSCSLGFVVTILFRNARSRALVAIPAVQNWK